MSISKMPNSKLKWHATKKFPHGRYTSKEISDEHKRRSRSEPNYHSVKAEGAEHDMKTYFDFRAETLGVVGELEEAARRKRAPKIKHAQDPIKTAREADRAREAGRPRYTKSGAKDMRHKVNREHVEPLDELSKKTLGNYIKRSSARVARNHAEYDSTHNGAMSKQGTFKDRLNHKKFLSKDNRKRVAGMDRAIGKLTKEETVNELSSKTLGRYASKAMRHADIGASSGASDYADKRSKGAQTAAKKLGAKAGDKAGGTRTANNIAKNTELAKKWRSDKSVDRNKTHKAAERGINKLWNKAATNRGNN